MDNCYCVEVNGITIPIFVKSEHGQMSEKEIEHYTEHVKQTIINNYNPKCIKCVVFDIDKNDSDFVYIEIRYKDIPFERIRRITGYLVGTLDRFNNAKRAEESQRVKHNI